MRTNTEPRMETTRRFPRSLAEAFPHHYREQFDPLYQPPRERTHPDYWVMLAVSFGAGFVVALVVLGT
jgi:hypothetical protein